LGKIAPSELNFPDPEITFQKARIRVLTYRNGVPAFSSLRHGKLFHIAKNSINVHGFLNEQRKDQIHTQNNVRK
jgi:hypothetical protein